MDETTTPKAGAVCPVCGKAHRPLTEKKLEKLYGENLNEELRRLADLCPDCRRREAASKVTVNLKGRKPQED